MSASEQSYSGRRVAVIGLGIEGQDLARFFATHGASVIVSDAKPATKLEHQLASLADLDLELSLGANRDDLADDADLLALSQGVPLDLPPVRRARERGISVTSRTKLFFELCPGPLVGISGSSGKTTTTSLVGAIFAASGRQSIVGGNIGGPLLTRLDEFDSETWGILEISHTQLALTDRSPQVACLTNVTPNHLDQFTWADYVELKRNLITHQSAGDVAVLNLDNPTTWNMAADTAARIWSFTLGSELPGDGAFLEDGQVVLRTEGRDQPVLPVAEIPLLGRHNVENVLCASSVAGACGISADAIAEAVRKFEAVPHRLEVVATIGGITYVNDSIATTPERTLAGMRSFKEPLILLLGGKDKQLPLEELAVETAQRCRAVVCFGEAGALFARACTTAHAHGSCGPFIRRVETMDDAVSLARRLAQPGDVVLLSPGGTSFDAFDNFERRGEAFRALVGPETLSSIPNRGPALGRGG